MKGNDQDRFVQIIRLRSFIASEVASLFILILLLFFASISLSAQSSISTATFIKQHIQAFQKKINSTSSSSTLQTSWLNEMQFRTKTKDFDFEQQSYTLRMSLNSKARRKAEIQLFRQLQEAANVDQYTYGAIFLKMAYEDWLAIYSTNQTLQLHKKILVSYRDIETVLLELGQFNNLNIKDLLKVQRDITDVEITIQTLQKEIQYYLPDQEADFSDMITVENIEQMMNGTLLVVKNVRQVDQRSNLKSTMLASELAIKELEEKQWLDFIQVEFGGPYGDPFREKISIGAGFKIPNAKAGQLAIEEIKIEQDQLERKIKTERAIQEEKINRKKQELIALLEKGKLFKTLTNRQNTKAAEIVRLATQAEGATPLLMLTTNVEKIKQQLDLLKIEIEIFESYIDYLALTEQLFKRPFKNYLLR